MPARLLSPQFVNALFRTTIPNHRQHLISVAEKTNRELLFAALAEEQDAFLLHDLEAVAGGVLATQYALP